MDIERNYVGMSYLKCTNKNNTRSKEMVKEIVGNKRYRVSRK